jgi:ABC-2 type transport system ATP-binding protein
MIEREANQFVIQAKGLTKIFGNQDGVRDISFDIAPGQLLGFIGPSGSGKTTTVRLLAGIYPPTAGEITVLGHHPRRFTRTVREKIGYMPQLFALYPTLSVWENLNFAASLYGLNVPREVWLNRLLDFVELREHKRKLARNLSGGMQRRLSLAATLVHDPELIFLDEPTAGLDPVLRRKFWDHFKELQREGRTLFITTQYVGEAAYCDLVGVMVHGRLLMVETPEKLRYRAFGGEVVDLYTKERLLHRDLLRLSQLAFVKNEAKRINDGNGVRLVVEQANKAMPALLEWCQNEYVSVETIEEYLPPFDDVFVELVRDETHPE